MCAQNMKHGKATKESYAIKKNVIPQSFFQVFLNENYK